MLDSETGEVQEVELCHHGEDVERFYAALPRPVTVAIESTGYALWFHALMRQLGHTLLVGDAAKIRAMIVRKTKTDRRDALHLLDLLKHDRLPVIWVPDPATRDLRALLAHRTRLVRMRTMVTNGLHAIALSYRLVGGSKQLTRSRVAELQRLALPVHTGHRRDESLELLGWLDAHIRQLDHRVAEAADGDPGFQAAAGGGGVAVAGDEGFGHGGLDPAGADAVGADSPSGAFEREDSGQLDEARLRGGIGGVAPAGNQPGERGDVDDGASTAGDQGREGGFAAEERPLEVDVEDLVPEGLVELSRGRHLGETPRASVEPCSENHDLRRGARKLTDDRVDQSCPGEHRRADARHEACPLEAN